jgi:predicted metalloprotease with PDZ domain
MTQVWGRRLEVRGWRLGVVTTVLVAAASTAGAQTREAIRYTLRFPAPQTNYVDVEAIVPTDGRPSVEMMMAVWTPGSYLIREYERNVEAVKASAGTRALPIDKTTKNRWRIAAGGAREVTLTYRVYSHEMTVRNNWVEADFALINGAPTFMTLADAAGSPDAAYNRPHDVTIELPAGWKSSVTGMPDAPDGAPNHYRAPDYDTLVDSPIVVGNPAIHRFTVDGKPHLLVDVGEGGVFDGARAARDLERIVQIDKQFWGSLPYDKYVFFNLLVSASGGLEHKNAVVMMASRWATGTRDKYLAWLSLASHEYFHLWNVKRLRPLELGPFDYEHEIYPRSLWISEGLTDYYADLQLARAGLYTTDEYLRELSAAIRTLQTTGGRLNQSAEMASFDAWIKQYRPDDNTVNSTISYYTKGAVLGFLLDARIRAATGDAKSLDDVMRLAFTRYSGARGFTPEDFRKTASEVAGTDLGPWFLRALESTEELDYGPALEWFGLQLSGLSSVAAGGGEGGWLGVKTKIEAGRLLVENVPRGTPAHGAGVNPGDEILAIDDFRVLPEELTTRLAAYRPGRKIVLLVSRRDELKRLDVTLGEEPPDRWTLRVRPDLTPQQRARLMKWLPRPQKP